MRHGVPRYAVMTGAALMLSGLAHGDIAQLGASQDNTLYQDSTGALSNGAGEHFFSGLNGVGLIRRGLLAFDVGAVIPAGSTITSVTLQLHMSRTISGDQDVALHEVLASWGEGTSDAPGEEGGGTLATGGDATWLHTSFDTGFWASAGGDFDPVASATTTVGSDLGFYTWSSAAMVADLQAWLDDPTSNHGWLLVGNETVNGSSKRFDSHENSNSDYWPLLTVEYTPVPAPGGLLALGMLGLLNRRRRGTS